MSKSARYLQAYIDKNYKKVGGWLGDDTIAQLVRINEIQHDASIVGHVGEIGVHHGKLFILLYLLTREEEQAVAIDIFEQQELNVDFSGRGSQSVLEKNLENYAGDKSKLNIINADSTTIGAKHITDKVGGKVRLLSIDGGHLAGIVRHDLNTASAAICDGGVVILDDYFNPEFPGVSEGVNQFFLLDNQMRLIPFLVGMNKIYLTTPNHAELYIDRFAQTDIGISFSEISKFRTYNNYSSPIRITEMFGSSVLSYSPDHFSVFYKLNRTVRRQRSSIRKQLGDSNAWTALRSTRVGRLLRSIANKLAPY